jgi:hypothetical protein
MQWGRIAVCVAALAACGGKLADDPIDPIPGPEPTTEPTLPPPVPPPSPTTTTPPSPTVPPPPPCRPSLFYRDLDGDGWGDDAQTTYGLERGRPSGPDGVVLRASRGR